jgi:hypothetical protein
MLKDVKEFPFLQTIIENHLIIQKEFLEAKKCIPEIQKIYECGDEMPVTGEDFNRWARRGGFDKKRIGYAARGSKPVTGIPILTKKEGKLFPDFFSKTYVILNDVPSVETVLFGIMGPNSHILPHRHCESKGLMIFHLCLFDLDGHAIIRVNDDILKYDKEKDHFLFYPFDEHEAYNHSNTYRVNLLVEFPEKVFQYKVRNFFKRKIK